MWIFGTAGEAETSIYDSDLTVSDRAGDGGRGQAVCAALRGSSAITSSRLPMAGSVSSLNVSVATGVCLFEAVRQRRGSVAT